MKKIVVKFGGTSVGSTEKIINAAKIVKKRCDEGKQVVVVVSAMADSTNELVKKSNEVSKNFDKTELDVLISSGEQVSSSLLSGALIDLGIKSRSWLGWQIPILTTGNHNSSRILQIQTDEILKFLNEGGTPVIAGFQGISEKNWKRRF